MRRIIFYSWQSDLPNATNRGFVQTALERAAASIVKDDSVAVEPVVDRDTQGVAGAPDIASTILAKIAACDVFVADVSIVGRPEGGRPVPNPNVLIELGYAMKALGHECIVLVYNAAFGTPEELPFDLRGRRLAVYNMTSDHTDRSTERGKLKAVLEAAIKSALENRKTEGAVVAPIPAIEAIENDVRNKTLVLRRNFRELTDRIIELEPVKPRDGGTIDDLLQALDQSQEIIAEFSKIAQTVAALRDQSSAIEMLKSLGRVVERYDLPKGFGGSFSRADFDYFRVLGHELLVTIVALMLEEEWWDGLQEILNEPIPVPYLHSRNGPTNVSWNYLCQPALLLADESRAKSRVSLHADILRERHVEGGLAAIVPMEEFMAADYFLYLCCSLPPEDGANRSLWRAWSSLYLDHVPRFLINAEYPRAAHHLVSLFKLSDIEQLKSRLAERGHDVMNLYANNLFRESLLADFDIGAIGTRA